MAARRPRRRRHHPGSPDRRLRDRVSPRPAPHAHSNPRRASPRPDNDPRKNHDHNIIGRRPGRGHICPGRARQEPLQRRRLLGLPLDHRHPRRRPSFKRIAGSRIILINGQTITADDAYLEQSIANPDAKIVKGYRAGVMPAAIASYNLTGKPNDIRALVAFIKAQK